MTAESSTKDIRRTKDPKGISKPKEKEELDISGVAEGVNEEKEEGATAWRARSPRQTDKNRRRSRRGSGRYTNREG